MSTDSPSPEEPHLPAAPPLSDSDVTAAQPQSNRMLLYGLGGGFLLYAAALGLTVLQGATTSGNYDQGYWALGLLAFMVVITVVVLIAGLVLVFLPRTRKLGAGLLISIALGLFVDGGACIALLSATAG